ncbi:MAG: hypothetical protein IKY01_12080 [Prevotella sp.]|nr:hypothetical protein [Prevotella sp.]
MKRFIYSVIAMLALGCTFVACGDDNDDPSIDFTSSAEEGSAGTYTGEWTRISSEGTDVYSGTITLTAAGTNATNVTFSCPDASINASSIANVWHANYGYQFFNQTTGDANKLGVAFSGRIDEAGNLDASFTLSQRVGRKNYEFKYEFRGKK